MPLTVAPILAKALRDILSLSEEQRDELINLYEESKPHISASRYADKISGKARLTPSDLAYSITRGLIGVLPLKIGQSTSDYLDLLSQARNRDTGKLVFDTEEQEIFRDKASLIVTMQNGLNITAKVAGVSDDQDHVFCGARILTDIRPVFGDDVNTGVAASVICHTLKIEYHDDSLHKDFYVVLETGDLQTLKELIQREEQKANILRLNLPDTVNLIEE